MQWTERSVGDEAAVQALSDELNSLPKPLTRFLILRGIDSLDTARHYFRATRASLHDPHLLADIEVAAQRIAQAIKTKEKVLVYGDFDADGVTSTALILQFLQSNGLTTSSYIPHRQKENHGFHASGVELAHSRESSLIIVVDCGTNDEETAALAKEAGINLIICDHHQNEGKNPFCCAHVNPKREGCDYPLKDVSACALAYKLVQVTLEELGQPVSLADDYLDLVAISTVCDIMPLVDENRILVREGLEKLRTAPSPGLRALTSVSGCELEHLTANNIAMQLGPRLNAAGRLAHADEALALLMAESESEATAHAKRLNEINIDRKKQAARLRPTAKKLAQTQLAGSHTSALVLHHPDWHPGILGSAASQMVGEFGRPAVMLTDVPNSDGEEVFGSVRTHGDIHILDAIRGCADMLIRFGGHAKAAGLTLKKEDLPLFKEKLNAEVFSQVGRQVIEPQLEYDAQLNLAMIPGKFERVLKSCEPFGKENEAPLFFVEGLQPVSVRLLSRGQHLKMLLKEPQSNRVMDAIGFWQGRHHAIAEKAREQQTGLDILCYVEENRWNGRVTTQLRIEALREHSPKNKES